jgi:hypothetical protein
MLSDPNIGEWMSALVATFGIFGIIVATGALGSYFVNRLWRERPVPEDLVVVRKELESECRLSA